MSTWKHQRQCSPDLKAVEPAQLLTFLKRRLAQSKNCLYVVLKSSHKTASGCTLQVTLEGTGSRFETCTYSMSNYVQKQGVALAFFFSQGQP